MTASLNVVEFPTGDIADVPRGLRAIADQIESGEFGDAYNMAWVIDCGDARIEVGMLGHAAEPGATAHLLFGIAVRKMEDRVLNPE